MNASATKPMNRRALLASLLSVASVGVVGGAAAQTVTDWHKTDLLRNGVTSYGDGGSGYKPGYGSGYGPYAPPPPPPYGGPYRPEPSYDYAEQPAYRDPYPYGIPSALPGDLPLDVIQGDHPYRVVIDPLRSQEFRIEFGFDSADLTPMAREQLSVLGRLMQTDLRVGRYLIAGHTDTSGTLEHNMALSTRRAVAVRSYLCSVFGVDQRKLFSAGFGPTHLRDPMRPTWPGNRRVEVVLIKNVYD
jgi:outer membrane protein OmpA-like peptidoglycan-associated protein